MELKTLVLWAVMAAVAPAAALADEEIEWELWAPLESLRGCLAASEGGFDGDLGCLGVVAALCEAELGGNARMLDVMRCVQLEHGAWDILLNEEYLATRTHAEGADMVTAGTDPHFANFADSLTAAQRAWIAYREAECGLAHARWGAGSQRQIAGARCRLALTADRTVELKWLREETM